MTSAATRNNFRDFGAPAAGAWFGRGRSAERYSISVTIERHGRGLTVRNLSGVTVDSFGDTAKFWFVPEGTPAEDPAAVAARKAEQAAAHARATAYLADLDAREAAQRTANEAHTAALLTDAGELAEPAETTWDAMGRPDVVVYYGQSWRREAPRLVRFNEYGNRMFDALTGRQIGHWASDVRKMLAPAPVAREVQPAALSPVVVIPCGARKATGRVRAAEKYTGPYARSARRAGEALARRTGARILTLSARFGLLEDDDLVDDYDLKMGAPGSVTAATVAEQAARLGITDALVAVIAGKAYADVVSTVWPHAVRVLDGAPSFGAQRARMSAIEHGEWSPAVPAAAAVPALFGADLVAPPAREPVDARDLVRGDVVAPGSFGIKGADPILIVASAVAADVVHGAPRVELAYRVGPGRSVTGVVFADSRVDLVGREPVPAGVAKAPEAPLEPITDAVILEGPAPTPSPAECGRGYISLPAGCSLPEYGLLPSNVVVVLARGEFWNSPLRDTPNLTMHIVTWGLPGVALCRTSLVATERREEHPTRDGGIAYRHTGAPGNLDGRQDARYGYPGESTCDSCRREMARQNREGLPWQIIGPMKEARRAVRLAQRAAAAERRALGKAAAAAAKREHDDTAALESVEPVDLADVLDQHPARDAREGRLVAVIAPPTLEETDAGALRIVWPTPAATPLPTRKSRGQGGRRRRPGRVFPGTAALW